MARNDAVGMVGSVLGLGLLAWFIIKYGPQLVQAVNGQAYMNGVATQLNNSADEYKNGYMDGVLAQQANELPTITGGNGAVMGTAGAGSGVAGAVGS